VERLERREGASRFPAPPPPSGAGGARDATDSCVLESSFISCGAKVTFSHQRTYAKIRVKSNKLIIST
jgi:hypothetical protein